MSLLRVSLNWKVIFKILKEMFTRYFFSAPLAAGLPDATGAGRNDQVGAVPAVVVPANPEAGVRTEGGQEQQLQNCLQHPRT